MLVLDASVLVELLLRTRAAGQLERRLFLTPSTLHGPHLVDLEVAQTIRRYALAGELDAERGRLALADLADFPMRRHAHELLLERIWQLRNNLTAYDAVYVALAEALDAILLTRDVRIASAAGHRARIELV
ncbi:MAG: ribonuclease VapC1 [Alphaproteobacteria bacterium]|nr:MAG: ribonuclease VapC1 [Alphaproteobacteria bacterium]